MEGNITSSSSSSTQQWTMEIPIPHSGGNSSSSSSSSEEEPRGGMFGSDFIRLDENDKFHLDIKEKFISDLDGFHLQTEIVSIHRNCCSSLYSQGKMKAFQNYYTHLGENGNLRQAWFTAPNPHDIISLLRRGYFTQPTHFGIYGHAVYLSPQHLTLDCLQSCVPDEDGVSHMVFCRVIMGEMEKINPVSKQNCSSSNRYHSGVDDLLRPTKYIIWNAQMNTHIFPVFVITFKSSNTTTTNTILRPTITTASMSMNKKQIVGSPRLPLPMLIDNLSKVLPQHTITLLRKHHMSFMEDKMGREEIIKTFRDIVGDQLLVQMIKDYRYKLIYGSRRGTSPHTQNKSKGRN